MKFAPKSRLLLRLSSIALAVCLQPMTCGYAQVGLDAYSVPPEKNVDKNGVDLVSGKLSVNDTVLSGGDQGRPLSLNLRITSPSWLGPFTVRVPCYYGACPKTGLSFVDFSLHGILDSGGPTPVGKIGNVSSPIGNALIRFGDPYRTTNPDGTYSWPSVGTSLGTVNSTLTGTYIFYDESGNAVHYRGGQAGLIPYIDKIVFSNGEEWKYLYNEILVTNAPNSGMKFLRLKFVKSNRGYGLQFSYDTESISSDSSPLFVSWFNISKVTFYNKAQVYCDETQLVDCSAVLPLSSSVTFVSDMQARTITINRPGEQGEVLTYSTMPDLATRHRTAVANSTTTYTYDYTEGYDSAPPEAVASVSKGGQTWQYSHPGIQYEYAGHPFAATGTTVTDPIGNSYQGSGLNVSGALTSFANNLGSSGWVGQGYDYQPDTYRLRGIYEPESDWTSITRDGRGNITEAREKAKSGSGLGDIVKSAVYSATCANFKTCNKPTSITDAKSNTTSYTYSSDHGGVLTETGPAVAGMTPSGWVASGIQPVKRYSYVQRYAWVKNSSGGYVQESAPVWLLSEERFCKTGATLANNTGCVLGASDEVVTAYDYGPNSGPNNLFLRGVAVTADGVTQRTCYGYDVNGRKIYETKPRAGLASCN